MWMRSARQWYSKAIKLGDKTAARLLRRLNDKSAATQPATVPSEPGGDL